MWNSFTDKIIIDITNKMILSKNDLYTSDLP